MKKITIVTHNGNFHSDEIFAVAALRLLLKNKRAVQIFRTRDEKIIEKGDYVVDVGFKYKPKERRFDHHQNGLKPRKNSMPYAAFGLVWKEYGKEICGGSVKVRDEIDKILVQPIDAVDNGVEVCSQNFKGVFPYSIGRFFFAFNPSWKEKNANMDEIFEKLTLIAESALQREILKVSHKFEAFDLVKKEYHRSKDKRVIVLKDNYPWEEVLFAYKEPLFIVYPDVLNDAWNIKAVKEGLNSFKNRKDLPESWAGRQGRELQKITGIKSAIFCHKKRFMVSAKTFEDAMALVNMAL